LSKHDAVSDTDQQHEEPPESLFDARESLARIRDYARQRMVSPEGLLIRVLMRANVGVGPRVMIPRIIGSPKPLNLAVIGVGPSGMGKSSSDDVAEEYWPLPDIPTLPLGTAEGTCQAFEPDDDGQPQVPAIIFASSEIDNWAALGERAGSMTFPVLRQIITGDQIGQKNASKAHTRIVQKRSYAAGLSLSAQPGGNGASILFADAPGGFPQRCLFGSEIDREAPDEPPTGVEPYVPPRKPDFTPNVDDRYEIPFPDTVVREIREHRRQVLRGDTTADPLDGHRNLTKAKVAAALMILEGRNTVTEDDWRIAERIMQMSDRARAALAEAAKRAVTEANRARGHAIADRDEVVADRRMQRAKQAILRWLAKKSPMAGSDLRQKLKADIRPDYGAAIAELADEGLIRETQVPNGVHYSLNNTGTGVPEGHPTYPQFSGGVPLGTGVPEATVTEIDSRRSHRPRETAREWLAQHLAKLRAEGHTTAESFAVLAAAEAAGHARQSVRVAASDSREVTVIGRRGKIAIWDITGTATTRHQGAAIWVAKYIRRLAADGHTFVDKDKFRAAAQAAGYSWTSARHAATESGLIESEPGEGSRTTWVIRTPDSDDGEATA